MNTENLRRLSNIFDLKSPPIMAHLDSQERKAREEPLHGVSTT